GSWWYATVTRVSALVSSHQSVSFADMAKAARDSLVPGLQFFCLASLCVAALTVAVPFYAAIGGFWGTLATSFSVWILAAFVLILQYFLPAGATARVGFKDSLRISVALFFDAPFFSLGLAAYGIGCVALSPVLAFLLPGPAAAALAGSVATGIRMRKLRWLQANGGTPPGPAPWNELLSDDIEAVGVRSIKDFVFPWRH
ncbi:MAG: hypothetical protein JXM71_11210, partial [Spirochaetales bacterium]|nr:hypothetical protein [Spirochaetales bacterium]